MANYPQRVVCLAAEGANILCALGLMDRVVGVSAFTTEPADARQLPRIGGFSTPDLKKITDLRPDLALTISDIQADIGRELVKQGVPVLALNPHSLADIWQSWRMVGGVLGVQEEAARVVRDFQRRLDALRAAHDLNALRAAHDSEPRPKVYFEEWPDPTVSGIGWVGELIQWMGGEDIFGELSNQPHAPGRVVEWNEIVRRAPDVIIASWCGKPADLDAIKQRPGWDAIPAVRHGRVYEIDSTHILQVGPGLYRGAELLRKYIDGAQREQA